MTPKEQNMAIAEARGWQRRFSIDENDKTVHWVLYDSNGNCIASGLPDYLNDLNAMHEAERTIPALPYLYRLQEVVGGHDFHMNTSGHLAQIIKATAAQRAEAFLRTIGKWKDTP